MSAGLNSIPRFYKRKDELSPDSIALQASIKQLARTHFLKRCAEEVNITDDHFRSLLDKMCQVSEPYDEYQSLDGKTITYDEYMALARSEQVHPVLRRQLFTPEMFFMFPKNLEGSVYADVVFSCAAEMREQRRIRYDLAQIDKDNTGHLSEMQLVKYFDRFMKSVPDEYIDVYLAVVVRKFVFFLEQNKRIAIRDLMVSPILKEFRNRDSDQYSWFHPTNIYRLYDTFIELDEDSNRFLSKTEMCNFNLDGSFSPPRITPLIVDRLFACRAHRTEDNPQGELDFREFLDFVLAFQSKSNAVSLKYFWQILDIRDAGYLTASDVCEFVKSVFDSLGQEALLSSVGIVLVEDVQNEIFDMANAGKSSVITLDDLNRSGHGATIVKVLTDPLGFIDYEQRETRLAQQQQQQQQQQQYTEEAAPPTEEDYAAAAERIFQDPASDSAALTGEPVSGAGQEEQPSDFA